MNSKVLEKENNDDDKENILQQNYLSDLKKILNLENEVEGDKEKLSVCISLLNAND